MADMILFDLLSAQPSGNSKFHGGGEYIKRVFKRVIELGFGSRVVACLDGTAFIDDWILDLIIKEDVATCNVKSVEDIYSLINTGDFETFYSGLPYWFDRSKVNVDIRCIGTVHGLRSVECPFDKYSAVGTPVLTRMRNALKQRNAERYKKSNIQVYEKCISGLDVVVTDSMHSKYAIEATCTSVTNIVVAYAPEKHVAETPIPVDACLDKRFILLVSCNRWEKNPFRAIKSLDSMFDKGLLSDIAVVCCGLRGSAAEGFVRNRDRFIGLDYVTSGELEWLYANCAVFFYPTLNEGFGYPPLEAMRHGATCVVSGVCSLPEICGDAVYYANPYDLMEMQTRLLQALSEPIDATVACERASLVGKAQREGLDKIVSLITSED